MIIKRSKVDKLHHPDPPPGQSEDEAGLELESHGPEEDPWSQAAFESGLVADRRDNDRRRGSYRRAEDKLVISNAHDEAHQIRETARKEGFEAGLSQSEAVLAELRDALNNILSGREEALLSVANEISGMAIKVAERIIRTEVSCDETLVMKLVRDTIKTAGRNIKSLIVKVNAEDVALVEKTLKSEPIPNLKAEIEVMADEAVDVGSCIIETSGGLIDATFTTQLEVLRKLFNIQKPNEQKPN